MTQEIKDRIVYLYKEDKPSMSHIERETGVPRRKIKEVLLKANVELRPFRAHRAFSKEEEEKIIYLYVKKEQSMKDIGIIFNVSAQIISKILHKNQIPIVYQRYINKGLDDNYFETIDTEGKAYFLGLLFSDGAVNEKQIHIGLHERDVEIIEKFKKEIKSSGNIFIRRRPQSVSANLVITSKKMIEDLAKYGVVQNKTKVTKKLPSVPKNLLPHFLRGLVDGDGWLSITKQGRYIFGFCSYSEECCREFQRLCNTLTTVDNNSKLGLNGKTYNSHSQSKVYIKQIATALYKDSNFYLSRKYAVAASLFETKNDEDIV